MEDAASAVTPLDPEMVRVGDSVGHRAERSGLLEGAVWLMGVVEVLVLAQHGRQVRLVQYRVRSSSSRRQLLIQRSMTEFIRGARAAERMTLKPAARNTASNAAVTLASLVMQHELHPRPGVLQVHGQVP